MKSTGVAIAIIAIMLTGLAQSAIAAEMTLNQTQALGRRLMEQHCGVCHTRPTLLSGMYGPELSRETAGGQEAIVREVIANGTPRMPGFRYMFNADQIAAIAAYLKVLPPGTQAMTVPTK